MEVMMLQGVLSAQEVGSIVRRQRVMAGMGDRVQLAVKAGVAPEFLRAIEKGEMISSREITDLDKIVEALGLNPESRRGLQTLLRNVYGSPPS